MYDRGEKSFRNFIVEYGPDGIGRAKVQARSSLEAGNIFMEQFRGETMVSITDTYKGG